MELVLPQNYVDIEQEEMMYLDRGGVITLNVSANFLKSFAIASVALIATYISAKYFGGWKPAYKAIYAAITAFVGAYITRYINKGFTVRTSDFVFLPNWNISI